MPDEVLLEKVDGGVLLVTLNRPHRMNAIDDGLRDGFAAAMREAEGDGTIRAVVLTGAGTAFCVGADLKESSPGPDSSSIAARAAAMRRFHDDFSGALYDLSKPTIALVNGAAAGGGFGLALAADFRIASTEALFVSAFSRIALAGDNGVTYGLHRAVGRSRALEILALSPRIDADTAREWGLVREVVAPEALVPTGLELARKLAEGSMSAYAMMKANLAHAETSTHRQSMDQEAQGIAIANGGKDSREAIAAFLEKRRPNFG